MKDHHKDMVLKAKLNRAKLDEDATYQREFLADQKKLMIKMKNVLVNSIQQEAEKVEYLENWVFIVYFFDLMHALREHVAERRQRIDEITRVPSNSSDFRHYDCLCFSE